MAAGIAGTVCVANHNAPDQTVIGGEPRAVAELGSRLAAEGFASQVLPVPRPFHTPLMATAQEALRQVLQGETILPPCTLLLSSVTNRYVADPLDIRAKPFNIRHAALVYGFNEKAMFLVVQPELFAG